MKWRSEECITDKVTMPTDYGTSCLPTGTLQHKVTYRKSLGVSDWAASLSKMYCIRRWRPWVSDSRQTAAWDSNSWGRPASHIICWFLSVRTRDLSRPHTYSCSSPAIWTQTHTHIETHTDTHIQTWETWVDHTHTAAAHQPSEHKHTHAHTHTHTHTHTDMRDLSRPHTYSCSSPAICTDIQTEITTGVDLGLKERVGLEQPGGQQHRLPPAGSMGKVPQKLNYFCSNKRIFWHLRQ